MDQTPADSDGPDTTIYPDMPCYVANDAEFRAAVEVGLADARAGRLVSFDAVKARFQDLIDKLG